MLVDPLTPDGPPAPEATLILPDELAIPFPLVSETDARQSGLRCSGTY
jgi:hypothetical protein